MPGWMANSVGLQGSSGMTGLEEVTARALSNPGVFAGPDSASLEGTSEILRRYTAFSTALGALRVRGRLGVMLFIIVRLLKQPLLRRCVPIHNRAANPVSLNFQQQTNCNLSLMVRAISLMR